MIRHSDFSNNEKFEKEIAILTAKYPEYEKELSDCIPVIFLNDIAPKLILSEDIKDEKLRKLVFRIYESLFNIKS